MKLDSVTKQVALFTVNTEIISELVAFGQFSVCGLQCVVMSSG